MKNTYINIIISLFTLVICSCGSNTSSNDTVYKYEEPEEEDVEMVKCPVCHGAKEFTHRCSSCDGTGRLYAKYTHSETGTCSSCGGLGILACRSCGNYGYVTCTRCGGQKAWQCGNCQGTGYVDFSIRQKCLICIGEGYIYCKRCKGSGREICSSCNGERHLRCSSCNGTGGSRSSSVTADQGECPLCRGTGREHEICDYCDGYGKVKK